MSNRIRSGIVPNQPVFTHLLEGVTTNELKTYCNYAKLNIHSLKVMGRKKHWIPGHYFIGLFRFIISEMGKQDLFPHKHLKSFSVSVNNTFENRIYTNQRLIVKMQLRTKAEQENKEHYWIEFVREEDNHVVLAGMFGFIF